MRSNTSSGSYSWLCTTTYSREDSDELSIYKINFPKKAAKEERVLKSGKTYFKWPDTLIHLFETEYSIAKLLYSSQLVKALILLVGHNVHKHQFCTNMTKSS